MISEDTARRLLCLQADPVDETGWRIFTARSLVYTARLALENESTTVLSDRARMERVATTLEVALQILDLAEDGADSMARSLRR